MAVECGQTVLLIDCGLTFSRRELGVDVVHPDFTYVQQQAHRVKALLLTHGHEDHIGATPFLLRLVNVPVYGPRYTLALLEERLKEDPALELPAMCEVSPGDRFEVGPIEVEPVRVTHSMVDTTCLVLRTPAGVLVHSGDFKIDPAPPDGEHFNETRLAELGREGVRLLLGDSTNIDVQGEAGGEDSVAAALESLIAKAPRRVVVCLFASNTHRLGAVLAAAQRCGRHVLLLGRSLQTHHRLSQELGLLPSPEPFLVPPEEAANVPPERLLVAATGTQGEPRTALQRLANRTHDVLRLEEGDEVIMSSRIIPGNEAGVLQMIDTLERQGVRVWHRGLQPELHVSGHACRAEQQRLLELTRPQTFVPIHGTYHHLKRHAELARSLGVTDTLVVKNGDVLELDDTSTRIVGSVPNGRVHIQAGREIAESMLRERELLAQIGLVVVVVTLDMSGGLLAQPVVLTRGVVDGREQPDLLAEVGDEVARAVASLEPGASDIQVRGLASRTARLFFANAVGWRPLVHTVVTRPTA